MTSKDAMESGGAEPLPIDPRWPGLDGGAPVSEFDPAKMRTLAGELEEYIGSMKGPAYSEGYTTGSKEGLQGDRLLTEAELGAWPAASALVQTVGSSSGENGGRALGIVYNLFITRLEEVVKAIHANADEYGKAAHANNGGNSTKA
ncbi:hypothetical protein [Streptosporangium sp. NBC_01756]|uniref:hypothetical protein n=1 Tax=Streptosporangium sp. NBC_01756 TaxID=2975950 RepID=UPI002DDC78DE|nr:hypothetical protein [Streptosporangium sp. NBC_01756]WSC88865.1 hypothetical protein OIE48_11980 [Streptosporangium sp. NBC_01756]